MNCPACSATLERKKTVAGPVWACPEGHGRAATVESLRGGTEREAVNALWIAARATREKGSRRCPQCGRSMALLRAPGAASAFELDACASCRILWFDPGELEALPLRPPPPQAAPLPAEARKILAIAEVKRIGEGLDSGVSELPASSWQWLPGLLGLPVEEDPGVRIRPWVTWGIAAAILATSLLAFFDLDGAIARFGFRPADAWRDCGLTLLSAFFLHGSWLHLLGNLYFLLIFGDNVEESLGSRRYAALILAATILGGALHAALDPRSGLPCIGASGGISGVLAFYALAFPLVRIRVLLRWGWIVRWLTLPALVVMALWFILQLLGATLQLFGATSVSFFAHLGGAAAGGIAWGLWRRTQPI